MKKILFVFNPNSGKGQIKNNLMKIIQIFSEEGYEVTVYPTKAEKDGYEYLVKNEGNYDIIACSGGDGTLNETVAAVMGYSGIKPPIGYIPSGTTNDFANSLNIPKNMISAARHIVNGSRFSIDVGIVNKERYFNYVAAFGAFTTVSYATPQSLKNVLGHQAYVLEAVKSLSELKPIYMEVESDGVSVRDWFVYGMVSNTMSVGGLKGLTGTGIDLQDGLFEVTLIKEIKSPLDFQQLVTAFLTQKLDECETLYSFRTNHITFKSDEKVAWTLDGEFGGKHDEIVFDVIEKAVDFLVKTRKMSENESLPVF